MTNFLYFSKVSKGDWKSATHILYQENNYISPCIHSACTFDMTDLADFDHLSSFDTDSSFLVCDNSATGHMCNNKALFADEVVLSILQVGSATGISVPNLMSTVIL